MPRVSSELDTQYWEPVATGPIAQADISASALLGATLPTTGTIAASGNWTSSLLPADGFKCIGVGCKSTQTGAINIQRYLDTAGLVPVGAVLTAALTAATAQWLTNDDNTPFQSFTVQITNTGGSAATVTNFALVLNAD